MLILRHIIALFSAFFFGLYIVPVMIRAAKKLNMFDQPDGKIKKHKEPTPYFGGLAVYITFIFVLALVYPFGSQLLWFLLGTTLLLFVGLVDDFNALTPVQKIAGQIVATGCFLKGGYALKSRFFSDYINIAASGFWILSVINAFNLVDVMDGLCATLAIVSAISFFIIAIILQQYSISLLLIVLIGALLAFLFYNKPRAKIYLGDAGSLFVGGFIAAMPLLIHWTEVLNVYKALPAFASGSVFFETAVSALVPILLVGIPLLEITSLVVIRVFKGIPFYSGSPHHFASYLRNKNWSDKKVLLFATLSSSFLSSIALLFMFGKIFFLSLIFLSLIFLVSWLLLVFGRAYK